MTEFKINLGSEVKDKITGFKGVVRARTQYLTGCNVYGCQNPKLDDKGNPQEWKWFDEDQLKLVKDRKVVIYDDDMIEEIRAAEKRGKSKMTGGPLDCGQLPPS